MPGFCVHSLLIKVCFQEGEWGWERDCAWKRESLGDIRVLFCLTSPGQKLLSVAIQAGKSACARYLLCRSQGPPELEQRGVCSYCPSPEWQLSVGPRGGLGGPGSHIQGWRTVLTETMPLPFKSPIRRCLNVNTCSHSLILSNETGKHCWHGSSYF